MLPPLRLAGEPVASTVHPPWFSVIGSNDAPSGSEPDALPTKLTEIMAPTAGLEPATLG